MSLLSIILTVLHDSVGLTIACRDRSSKQMLGLSCLVFE